MKQVEEDVIQANCTRELNQHTTLRRQMTPGTSRIREEEKERNDKKKNMKTRTTTMMMIRVMMMMMTIKRS